MTLDELAATKQHDGHSIFSPFGIAFPTRTAYVRQMKAKKYQLTREDLVERFYYDANTGVFTHLTSLGKAVKGAAAGRRDKDGYVILGLKNIEVSAHQCAWMLMTGRWPEHEIDHENTKRDDNRWSNLRKADRSQNCMHQTGWVNKKSGLPRCVFSSKRGNYRVICREYGKATTVGSSFSTVEQAVAARDAYEASTRGSWAGL